MVAWWDIPEPQIEPDPFQTRSLAVGPSTPPETPARRALFGLGRPLLRLGPHDLPSEEHPNGLALGFLLSVLRVVEWRPPGATSLGPSRALAHEPLHLGAARELETDLAGRGGSTGQPVDGPVHP